MSDLVLHGLNRMVRGHEKLMWTQLASDAIRGFITVFRKAGHWISFWGRLITLISICWRIQIMNTIRLGSNSIYITTLNITIYCEMLRLIMPSLGHFHYVNNTYAPIFLVKNNIRLWFQMELLINATAVCSVAVCTVYYHLGLMLHAHLPSNWPIYYS
jgi:hypothetical protein